MIFYWIETVDKVLLHAVYTANLSPEDAARLQYKMKKKRKINLIVLICGAALFICGLILPLLLHVLGAFAGTDIFEDNSSMIIGFALAGFAGLLSAIFAANKCFGVAGAYLKALRIAYPHLPDVKPERGGYQYTVKGVYDPKEYRTGTRNKSRLEELKSGQVDPAKTRGLLNYAVSGRSQSRYMTIFSFAFGALMLAVWAILNANAARIFEGSGDEVIPLIALSCGGVLLLSGVRWIFIYRANSAYIEAVRIGTPSMTVEAP